MRRARNHRDRLEDICEAVQKAMDFVQGMTYESFLADEKTVYAVVRALEIVGEATKRVPSEIRDRYAQVPWRSMAGMRDKLIHDYVSVNAEVVWKTVTEDLPPLLPVLQRVCNELGE